MSFQLITYQPGHREACLDVFKSNVPRYFDAKEIKGFKRWLDGQDQGKRAYSNSSIEQYKTVIIQGEVVACGGYYVVANQPIVRLAWGMVHCRMHSLGIGSHLTYARLEECSKLYPEYSIRIDTSQHTAPFYKKFGFEIECIEENGLGKGLHKFEMVHKPKIFS